MSEVTEKDAMYLAGYLASTVASWIGLVVISAIGWLSWAVVIAFPLVHALGYTVLYCILSIIEKTRKDVADE